MDDGWIRSLQGSIVEPPIPRAELIGLSDLPDREEVVRKVAWFAFDRANVALVIDLSRQAATKAELEAAHNSYHGLLAERDKVAPVRTIVTDTCLFPISRARRMLALALYAGAVFVALSLSWMTAQWVIDADLFDGIGHNVAAAILTTGIVLSAGVAAPIVAYGLLDTDQAKKGFARRTAIGATILGLAWLMIFALVDGLDGFNTFLVGHPLSAPLRYLAPLLVSAEALAKFILLPTQIAGECAAAVAVEIAATRFRQSNREILTLPNPYHLNLMERLDKAREEFAALSADTRRLEIMTELLTLGREVFASKCAAAVIGFQADQQAAAGSAKREHLRKQTDTNATEKKQTERKEKS